MIKTKGFLHFTISVDDLARATAFYRDVLGCEILNTNKIMTFMRSGREKFVLTKMDPHVPPNPPGPLGPETVRFHHAFRVEPAAFDRVLAHLRERAIPFLDGPARSVFIHDPEGNSIKLVSAQQ
jgi:glyoxylase I family protein